MMKGSAKIFLVGENDIHLNEMRETPFDKEENLQLLIAKYPDLLPGDQIDPEAPRRWLLVSREMGIPGEENGTDVWSLDHLFLDQDGVPTFVECKRASDSRTRREVVAQMLDYAANGIQYWTIDKLRLSVQKTLEKQYKDLDQEILSLISSGKIRDQEDFWRIVEQNLRNGRIRLLFVTENVPRELRRLVEFLNEKLTDVEVLAVELKQYIGQGNHRVIVPRIIGATESARVTKSPGSREIIDREAFLNNCASDVVRSFFIHILDYGKKQGYSFSWGVKGFSVGITYPLDQSRIVLMFCMPPNQFEFTVDFLERKSIAVDHIRTEIKSLGVLKLGGKSRFRADITSENIDGLTTLVDRIFSEALEWVRNPSQ